MVRSNTGDSGRAYYDLEAQVAWETDSQIAIRCVIYLTSRNVEDSNNDCVVTTSWGTTLRSGTLGLNGVYSGTPVWYADTVHDKNYGASRTGSFSCTFSRVEFWGATLSATVNFTIPARAYSAPAAPTSVTVTRVSDTSHTVRTQFTQSTAAPVTNAGYQLRSSTDGGATWSAWSGVTNGGHSGEYSVATVANRTYQVQARNQGPGGNSAFTASAVFHTTPAAPTGATVTRNSDTSHTITWAHGAAGSREKYVVERQVDDGSWAAISSSVAASATSYTDTTTSANHRYAYRVKAVRGSLSSAYSTTASICTTPAAPTDVTASRSGDSNVVTWKDASGFESGFTVERSQDGGPFGDPVAVAAGVTSWTHLGPALGSTWQYQVWATVTTPALSSARATSNSLTLPGAPNAPTNLAPTSVFDADQARALTWRHNPVDSSAQTAYQVQWRVAGTTQWTTLPKTASASPQWTAPAGTFPNGAAIEWQVSTWGTIATGGRDGAGASPWSATATFRTSGTPSATINAPEHASTLYGAELTVEWGFFDPEGAPQAAWRVELVRDGGTVETRQGIGPTDRCPLETRLPDESAWSVRVCVQDADGLWSDWDVAEFDVSYPRPPAAQVDTVWDPDTGTVAVQIVNPEPVEGTDPAVANDLWRSIDGGAPELIATRVPPNSAVTDFTPTLAGRNTYVVLAHTQLGAQSSSQPVDQPVRSDSVWINGGPGFSIGCRAAYNPQITKKGGRATKELERFDGRDFPVEFTSPDRTRSYTLSTTIPRAPGIASTWQEWLALADLPGPHMWRDLDGERVVVSISPVSADRTRGGRMTVSLSAERIDDA